MLKTVAVIFISDNFLKGSEENILKKLMVELNSLSYTVRKISILHENENIIYNELNILSKQFDVVIVLENSTDILFKVLAKITLQNLKVNLKFKEVLNNLQESSSCLLPVGSKVLLGNDLIYPVIQLQTIFILKEKYLEKHVNVLTKRLAQYILPTKYSKIIQIQMNGNAIQILDKMKNLDVTICQKNERELCVKLESTSFDDIVDIESVVREFQPFFIDSYIVSNILENPYTDADERILQALENIEKCLKDYGPENVFLSFNGGKDCTVLLHLISTVRRVKYPNYKNSIVCLYVKSENAFPEQDKFISQCQIHYDLEVYSVTKGIKEALNEILLIKPNLKACFMGTRRTDPFSNDLKTFQMTDQDWPQVMRASPLLDWHYSDIWDYLLYYKVPYCKLYDMGFTSLGNATNTIRNPTLLYNDIYLGTEVYLPAYKMLNESKERSGRNIL